MLPLTEEQKRAVATFHAFAEREIMPHADAFDREQRTPSELIVKLAKQGWLGAMLPVKEGGLDYLTFGLLCEQLGRASASIRCLLTVHCMVVHTLLRWGTNQQRLRWLHQLSTGEQIAAFCLTEPSVGSDAQAVRTHAVRYGDSWVLNGQKRWITYGQIADLFLVFAHVDGRPTAFFVERTTPGLQVQPILDVLGTRASMLAELHFQDCSIPATNLVGNEGFGFAAIAMSALNVGRYSVAWGCVGMAQACLDACIHYSDEREQFGHKLKDFQLIQQMIANMITNIQAARLLCYHTGWLHDQSAPEAITQSFVAKYFAARITMEAASDAVQIHGANGCGSDYPVQRYFRDAKIMEIIEGSSQMQQMTIAKNGYQEIDHGLRADEGWGDCNAKR